MTTRTSASMPSDPPDGSAAAAASANGPASRAAASTPVRDGARGGSRAIRGSTERPVERPPARRLVPAWVGSLVRAFLGLLLLAAAFAVYGHLVATRPEPGRAADADALPQVPVVALERVEVARNWTGYGTLAAVREVDVPARVTATVTSVAEGVTEGAWVRPGAVLVRLDASDYEREAEIASSTIEDLEAALGQLDVDEVALRRRIALAGEQVALAEREVSRIRDLIAGGVGRDRELDTATVSLIARRDALAALEAELSRLPLLRSSLEARISGQRSRLALARTNVERCTIMAPPADGAVARWSISAVDVEPGEALAPGQRVIRLVDRTRLEVPLRLPSATRDTIRVGDEVALRPTGTPGDGREVEVRGATIARLAPDDDPGSRTMTAWVELAVDPDRPGALAPGRFVRGIVRAGGASARIVLPRTAIDRDRVLVVEDGVLVSRSVQPAFTFAGPLPPGAPYEGEGPWVVLADELPEGTLVVRDPGRRLTDGLRVEPVVVAGGARP